MHRVQSNKATATNNGPVMPSTQHRQSIPKHSATQAAARKALHLLLTHLEGRTMSTTDFYEFSYACSYISSSSDARQLKAARAASKRQAAGKNRAKRTFARLNWSRPYVGLWLRKTIDIVKLVVSHSCYNH